MKFYKSLKYSRLDPLACDLSRDLDLSLSGTYRLDPRFELETRESLVLREDLLPISNEFREWWTEGLCPSFEDASGISWRGS